MPCFSICTKKRLQKHYAQYKCLNSIGPFRIFEINWKSDVYPDNFAQGGIRSNYLSNTGNRTSAHEKNKSLDHRAQLNWRPSRTVVNQRITRSFEFIFGRTKIAFCETFNC